MAQDELVDVINENGDVLEVVTKRKAHESGFLHKTVISEVIDSKGRWLMVKQSSSKQDAGQYVSPVGGHAIAGESEEDALLREAGEEIGLIGDLKYEYIGREIYNRKVLGRQENHLFIVYRIYSDEEPLLNHESESFRYFTEDELKKELKESPNSFGYAFHFIVSMFFKNLL